jgi:hypothetical protein
VGPEPGRPIPGRVDAAPPGQANARGAIWIYGVPRNLGRAHAGAEVRVQFDPSDRQWVVTDPEDRELKRFPASELSRARILTWDVGETHSKGQK